jgi:hypothetical protein
MLCLLSRSRKETEEREENVEGGWSGDVRAGLLLLSCLLEGRQEGRKGMDET